jgi:hypothetical protein
MTKDEALKLALEFIEANHFGGPDAFELITAIKQDLNDATHLAAPVQEPVAWRTYIGRGYYIIDSTFEEAQKNYPDREHQPLYTTPPAAQEKNSG